MQGLKRCIYNLNSGKVINRIKEFTPRTQRCLFILDQFGWSKVPFQVINDLFEQLTDVEVLLTFTPDHIIRYCGKTNQAHIDRTTRSLAKVGLDITAEELNETLNTPDSELASKGWLKNHIAQEFISQNIRKKLNAKYFTKYIVNSDNSNSCLFIIHLSNHQTAHDQMMHTTWQYANTWYNHQGFAGMHPIRLGYSTANLDDFFIDSSGFFESKSNEVVRVMMNQIPVILHQNVQGISFEALMGMLRNEAPVTLDIIKNTIKHLLNHKEIEIFDRDGTACARTKTIKLDDIIKLSRQASFIFPSS
jgi:hypothetical protein